MKSQKHHGWSLVDDEDFAVDAHGRIEQFWH